MSSTLLATPLQKLESELGARFVDFAGWSLPVSYTGILDEYWAVRRRAGLFDVSHMGRFVLTGPDAVDLLDVLLTNAVAGLAPGRGRYSLMCRHDGGMIDDVICFCLSPQRYLLVVNGATRERDSRWVRSWLAKFPKVQLQDVTLDTAMVALQGPAARAILREAFVAMDLEKAAEGVAALGRFQILQASSGEPLPLLISTTGYTGEDGVEAFGSLPLLQQLWSRFIAKGAQAVGLGARDILRLEMGYLLYGQDATEDNDPYQARLGWTVKLQKPTPFVGKDALVLKREMLPGQTLVGLHLQDRLIPRSGFPVVHKGEPVGRVTSGGFSPWLKSPIALAYVSGFSGDWGRELEVVIRGKRVPARVVEPPFIDKSKSPKQV